MSKTKELKSISVTAGALLAASTLIISPSFASEENPFKQKNRNFPIDLMYPFSDKYMINIMIPEGYEVESISENEQVKFSNIADFTYLANVNGSFLQLTVSLNINTSLILAQDYKLFKDFYTKIIEKQSEKIVLKKI